MTSVRLIVDLLDVDVDAEADGEVDVDQHQVVDVVRQIESLQGFEARVIDLQLHEAMPI